jgi:hypothetical protein
MYSELPRQQDRLPVQSAARGAARRWAQCLRTRPAGDDERRRGRDSAGKGIEVAAHRQGWDSRCTGSRL